MSLQAEYILDLQKQLALLGNEPRTEMNGSLTEEDPIASVTPVDKVLFAFLNVHASFLAIAV